MTQTIDRQVKESAKKAVQSKRVWRDDYLVGEGKDQGDLLMWISNADISTMEKVNATGEFQLAPGNTQGSRHTINLDHVDVYKPKNFGRFVNVSKVRGKPAGYIMGYTLVVNERTDLKHPEHPWHDLCKGTIQTAGQVDARTLEWAKD